MVGLKNRLAATGFRLRQDKKRRGRPASTLALLLPTDLVKQMSGKKSSFGFILILRRLEKKV